MGRKGGQIACPQVATRDFNGQRFRLAVYDPCEPDDSLEFFGPFFGSSVGDRYVARLTIERYNSLANRENLPYCIALFPWDS